MRRAGVDVLTSDRLGDGEAPRTADPARSTPTTLYTGKFLRLRSIGRWEYVERVNATGVVAILAITEGRNILLVEQFRPPIDRPAIELPAGLVGDVSSDEAEEEAVRRELLEETGYRAGDVRLLHADHPSSAGLTSETLSLYQATHLTRVGPAAGDGHERITLHDVPLAGLRAWLAGQSEQGKAVDAKIFAALWLAGIAP
jgi:ADP-ribose pyrophosphatase